MADYGTDQLLLDIADYVVGYEVSSRAAVKTARYAILDAVGCALLSLNYPECVKLLGPIVPGAAVKHGAHVIGTTHDVDPVTAAHGCATATRWLDYNDAWLGAEWVHPSDVVGAILPLAEYLSRVRMERNLPSLTMKDVVVNAIKAYEVVGILALENSLNQIGVDHIMMTRVAVAAVATAMLGGGRREVANAVSNAFADGAGLRCFRHYPNNGTRKGWAAGDAASRGVWLAMMTMRGEMGYDLVLSAPVWGFNDVYFRRQDLQVKRDFGEHVMENVLFKVAYPAEFHAQTAIEAAMRLHPQVVYRVDEVHQIAIQARSIHWSPYDRVGVTTRSAVRCVDKTGPLKNAADRDHCVQYAVAVALLYGTLTAEHYEDSISQDPRIDELRRKTVVTENPQYSADYADPDRRSVANAVQVHFSDRTSTSKVEAEYPLGHKRRRAECFPALEKKFMAALSTRMPPTRAGFVFERTRDPQRFDATAVPDFVELFHPSPSPFLLPPIRGGLDYVVPAGEGALALPPGGAGGGGKKGGGGGAGGNFGGGDAFEYASTDRGDDTDRTGAPAIGY